MTHEMGHVIGLVHTCYLEPPPPIDNKGQPIPDCADATPDIRATTMFPSADANDIEKRTLEADDKQGLCDLYAPAQDGCACATAGPPASGARRRARARGDAGGVARTAAVEVDGSGAHPSFSTREPPAQRTSSSTGPLAVASTCGWSAGARRAAQLK